ncbi:MAG: dockerin type I repeat-containing protein [Pirellulaceae bacterium]
MALERAVKWCTCLAAIVLGCACPAVGQSVDLGLDLYYSNPADTASSGTWQLVAKSSSRGIAGLDVRLTGIDPTVQFDAPTGTAPGIASVGFQQSFNGATPDWLIDRADHMELIFGQIPVQAPGSQGLFYDVGVPGGATQPGENGTPVISGLSGVNLPWGFDDVLGDAADGNNANNNGIFQGGVLLASGTFAANSNPGFLASLSAAANVFTAVGTTTSAPLGSIIEATTTVQVRDNAVAGVPGDYNGNGTVDAADYTVWKDNFGSTTQLAADGNGNGTIDAADYTVWKDNFGNSGGAAAIASVPEPTVALMIWLALPLLAWRRRS